MFSRIRTTSILFIAAILGLAYSSSHPTTGSGGYTSAPGDSTCGQSGCHSSMSSTINGSVTIEGLPATIMTNETYTITVTLANPDGNAAKAGFQLLALTGTNTNAGTMTNNAGNTAIKIGGGKNYFGHEPAQNFPASNELSFTVDWTAPSSVGSNPQIKFYAVSLLANGNGNTSGDKVVFSNLFVPIMGSSTPLDATITNPVNPTCFNSSNGRATVNPSGGSGTYTYSWSSGANTATATNLPDGTSFVTVSDGTTQIVKDVNLTAPSEIIVNVNTVNTCQGQNTGSAAASASGGTGNKTYLWSNGSTSPNISNLAAGNYTVTVKDANNCSVVETAVISASPAMNLTPTVQNASCNGLTDGSVNVNIGGGTGPFSYVWSNGSNTNPLTNVGAGIYTLTVTDNATCTKVGSYTISQPPAISATVNVTSQVSCFGGNNGSASVNITGGTPGYTYVWSTGAQGTGNSGSISNLPVGSYSVVITDFLDCQKTVNFTITQPIAITSNPSSTPVTCFGLTNGSASVAPTGGAGSFTYLWSNGTTTSSITNLPAATYSVTVKDASNCTKVENFTITQPQALISAINTLQTISCSGGSNGSLQMAPTGGNGGNSFLWSNNINTQVNSGLPSGTYTCTVTDSKGCTTTSNATLTQPQPMILTQVSTTPASCIGATNGSVTIAASNGTAPYTYAWANGSTGATLSNVASGSYNVTVTDGSGCTSLNVFSVGANTSFSLSAAGTTNVTCFGGSNGTACVANVAGRTYQWSNGNTGDCASGLIADTVSVVATDANNCQSLPLNFIITQPEQLRPSGLTIDSLICSGDSFGFINIDTLLGGTGTITYSWMSTDTSASLSGLDNDSLKAAIYTFNIKDASNCSQSYVYTLIDTKPIVLANETITKPLCNGQNNGSINLTFTGGHRGVEYLWNTGDTLPAINNLIAGNYTIVVTDSARCAFTYPITLTQPAIITSVGTTTNETAAGANDGTISLAINGGVSPYTVAWTTGQTGANITNLAPGVYNYQITDTNGCVKTGFEVVGGGNCTLTATATVQNAKCFDSNDGKITLDLPGNINNYKIEVFKNGNEPVSGLNNLAVGTYTVIIEDSLKCIFLLQNVKVNSTSPQITLKEMQSVRPSTTTSTNGSLTAVIEGGVGPFTYAWTKNGVAISGNSATQSNLGIGAYTVSVIDANGCTFTSIAFDLTATSATIQEVEQWIQLTPNPANDIVTISVPSNLTVEKLNMINPSGQMVSSLNQEVIDSSITLDVSDYPSGMYLVRIITSQGLVTKRLVISR